MRELDQNLYACFYLRFGLFPNLKPKIREKNLENLLLLSTSCPLCFLTPVLELIIL